MGQVGGALRGEVPGGLRGPASGWRSPGAGVEGIERHPQSFRTGRVGSGNAEVEAEGLARGGAQTLRVWPVGRRVPFPTEPGGGGGGGATGLP